MNELILPDWLGPKNKVDEVLYAQNFLLRRKLRYAENTFFGVDGKITDENALRKEIYEDVHLFATQGLWSLVDRLLDNIRLEACGDPPPLQETVFHLQNGTLDLRNGFTPQKLLCRNRLPVCFDESGAEPRLWLDFLNQLLDPEDILTLQEYMGYCLIPVTYGQKMLLIIGSGGEGKSRIGAVMHALLGEAMATGSIAKVEMSPFARADLQNCLLMVDDDLKMEALSQTHHLKTIITAERAMDLERKGIQSYQGRLYCRFMAFGNDTLQSLYDNSDGFFRRQIILRAKPRPKDRVDDPFLGKRLCMERDAIFNWAMEGLIRLIGNDFRFTVSSGSRQLMERNRESGSSPIAFLHSQGYYHPDPEASVTGKALYSRYRDWCEDNAVNPISGRSFLRAMENQNEIPLTPTNHVPIGNGRQARGYRGIRLCSSF